MKMRYQVHAVVLAVLCLMLPSAAQAERAYSCFCPNKTYVAGQYVCGNFANDFNKNCAAAGIQSCTFYIMFNAVNVPPECQIGHAMNVVPDPNPDLNPGDSHYCAVEPQTGQQWCWPQAGSGPPVVPPWILAAVVNNLGPRFVACYNQFKDQAQVHVGCTGAGGLTD